jgi:hypothetical protein
MKSLVLASLALTVGALGALVRTQLQSPPPGQQQASLPALLGFAAPGPVPSAPGSSTSELAELSSKELFASTLEEIAGAKLSARSIGGSVAAAQQTWEAIIAEVEKGRGLDDVLAEDVHSAILAQVTELRLSSATLWERVERLVIPKTQASHRYAEVAASALEEGSRRRELYMRVAASLAEQVSLLASESAKLASNVDRLRKAEAMLQGQMNDLAFLSTVALGVEELVAEMRELNQDLQALVDLIVPEE